MSLRIVPSLVLVLASSLLLGGCTVRNFWDKKPSGLDITTIPPAKIYLDGKEIGTTPYKNDNIKAGSYNLKLSPLATDSATLQDWETNLTLAPQVTTIISRTFASSLAGVDSSLLQLLPVSGSKSSYLSVISDPDTSNVTLDNKPYGFTPLSKLEVTPGNHSLLISSPGFHAQSLSVNTVTGYNLVVNVHLSADSVTLVAPSPTPSSSPSPSTSPVPSVTPRGSAVASSSATVAKPYVVVSDTADTQSLGGLNVRKEPSSSADSLGLAKIGEKLPYLDTNNVGWHQVTFFGKSGWVSGKYTTVVK